MMYVFDDGNDTAGRDRPSGAGATAVRTAAVRGIGYHSIPPVVSGPYRSGGRHFPCAGGACGTFLGGGADSSSAGDDLVSKVCTWRNALE